MTVLYVKRMGNALLPDGDEAIAELAKLPLDRSLRAEVKQQRNPAFHRLFWALCARIASGIGAEPESIATVFKMATGHTETIRTKSYGDIKIPKSISFAKLDNTGFRAFFDNCLEVAWTEWKLDPDAFADLLDPKTEIRK